MGAHYVIVQAAHQLAGLGVSEKAQTHALHMGVERLAQVCDKPLADVGAKIALTDTNQPAEQGNHNHPQRQPVEKGHITLGQGDVNQFANEQRRDQA